MDRNPLHILDSKNEGDQAILKAAPLYRNYLNAASEDFFAAVLEGLNALDIRFIENPRLVRGLDYYTHSCFEITAEELGAQKTVLAGGRYDGLVKMMGGPDVAGIGWAAGIERLSLMIAADRLPGKPRPVAVIPVGATTEKNAAIIAEHLRNSGLIVDMAYSGNLSKRMKRANKIGAIAAVLIGDEELSRDVVSVRELDSGLQSELSPEAAAAHLLALTCSSHLSAEALDKVESIRAAR